MSAADAAGARRVQVWDLPTRVFHWSLLTLILIAWFTSGEEGAPATVHRLAGEIVAGLIVFRLIWGFVGGERARFADFAAGPMAIIAHVRDLMSPAPKRHLGHNPVGGVAVFLLLLTVSVIVVTGLFSSGHEAPGGPFSRIVDLHEVHELAFRVLQGLVALHVLGVIVESWKARDALLPAMFTGAKTRRLDEPGADAKRARPVTFAVAAGAGIAVAAFLAVQPPGATYSHGGGEERHGGDDHGRHGGGDRHD